VDFIKSKAGLIMGYAGAVIGAGFASGQEILQFFVSHGNQGLQGCILAGCLFAVLGAGLLYLAHKSKVSNYKDALQTLLGDTWGNIIDILLSIFLFLGISTMLSAAGAVFYEHLFLPKSLGIACAYFSIIFFLLKGKQGMISTYNYLVPLKIAFLILVGLWGALFHGKIDHDLAAFLWSNSREAWLISSIIYVAYNFALAAVVLVEYQSISSQADGISGAFCGGLVLGIMLIISYLALNNFMPMVMHYQVPMLYVTSNMAALIKPIYTLVLWIGILTTAVANAYGFATRVTAATGLNYKFILICIMTLAVPLAGQNFAVLVNKIYPVLGLIGLLIILGIIINLLRTLSANPRI